MEPLHDIEATIRDIRTTLQHTKALVGTDPNLGMCDYIDSNRPSSPVWIPRYDYLPCDAFLLFLKYFF